jgi:hypothetical protein
MLMRRHLVIALIAVLILLAQYCFAQQKNEVAGIFGRVFVSHQTVPGTNFMGNSVAFGDGIAFEGNYARLLKGGDRASLFVEVPVIVIVDQDLNYGRNVIPEGYRAYFVTPSARVTLFQNAPVNPWFSFGGGFAHFSESSTLLFGGPNPGKTGNTTGVLQFGAGADIRILEHFSVRGEVRDFYSGVPQLNVNTGKSRQNNLFVGVGIVWHIGH